jgi:hypothetical protein
MKTIFLALAASLTVAVAVACDGDSTRLVGPAAANCGSGPYYAELPVALGDIDAITVFGGLGAPGHTLPTAHPGFYLATEGAEVRSPADMQITSLRRVTNIISPVRQGLSDYALDFQLCAQVAGWFGHLATLDLAILPAAAAWQNCRQYDIPNHTIETCDAPLQGVTVTAGQ